MNFFNQPTPNFSSRLQKPEAPPLDPARFQKEINNLDRNTLAKLVQQARQQGIPEETIQAGLNYILSL